MVRMPEPQFGGQSKRNLGSREIQKPVESCITEGLGTFLEENPQIAKRMVDKAVLAMRARDAAVLVLFSGAPDAPAGALPPDADLLVTVRASTLRHHAGQAAFPLKFQAQGSKVTPRKNVRNVIYVQNCGAMSPHEVLDFKETRFTAKDLEIEKVNSDFMMSRTLFPNYEKWAPKASLVRDRKSTRLNSSHRT